MEINGLSRRNVFVNLLNNHSKRWDSRGVEDYRKLDILSRRFQEEKLINW